MQANPIEGDELEDGLFIYFRDAGLQVADERQGGLIEFELFNFIFLRFELRDFFFSGCLLRTQEDQFQIFLELREDGEEVSEEFPLGLGVKVVNVRPDVRL